jgi:mRNA interferase RelE/StbE
VARVVLVRSAIAALAALDYLLADAILHALDELERDPEIGHQLQGRLRGLRSYKVGTYRIIYQLRDDTTVRVVAIRHRSQAHGTDPR